MIQFAVNLEFQRIWPQSLKCRVFPVWGITSRQSVHAHIVEKGWFLIIWVTLMQYWSQSLRWRNTSMLAPISSMPTISNSSIKKLSNLHTISTPTLVFNRDWMKECYNSSARWRILKLSVETLQLPSAYPTDGCCLEHFLRLQVWCSHVLGHFYELKINLIWPITSVSGMTWNFTKRTTNQSPLRIQHAWSLLILDDSKYNDGFPYYVGMICGRWWE